MLLGSLALTISTCLSGAACIGTVVSMIVYGNLGKGFAVGWKIHNIFWWKWFCGDLN